jgi:hypothetical protein
MFVHVIVIDRSSCFSLYVSVKITSTTRYITGLRPRRTDYIPSIEACTLTLLVEEGLVIILSTAKASRRKGIELSVSKATGGTLPGIDLNRFSDLEEVMNTP